MFRLFLGVEVVQVAVEFVEPVNGRQELVAVAEVVLAELAGGVSERLEQLGDRRVFLPQAEGCARQADFGQPGAQAMLAGDERRPTGGATLLGVVVGEDHPLLGHAVDVGRVVSHHPHRIRADVRLADVVAPDDADVRLLARGFRLSGHVLVVSRQGHKFTVARAIAAAGWSFDKISRSVSRRGRYWLVGPGPVIQVDSPRCCKIAEHTSNHHRQDGAEGNSTSHADSSLLSWHF